MRGIRQLATAALVTTLLTAATVRAEPTPRPVAARGILRIGWVSTDLWFDSTLDPANAISTDADNLLNSLYGGLVKFDSSFHVVPDLARALPAISADHLTYTFTLRPNLQFADGSPLTALDVVASISRALSKAEQSPTAMLFLGHIKGAAAWNAGTAHRLMGISAPDSRTVRITLDRPVSYFLPALAGVWVVKRGLAPGVNLGGSHAQSLTIGSGPFMFGKPWRYRQEVDLVPNPHWYGAASIKLKEIVIRFFSSLMQFYRAYQAGQVDITGVPSTLLPSLRGNPDLHAMLQPNIDFLSPNLGVDAVCAPAHCAPFDDIHFRRALLYAIDRSAITQQVLHGGEEPLCGLIPRGVLGYDPSLCSLAPYDPARARAELALAKKDFGGSIPHDGSNTLLYLAGSTGLADEAVALRNMWARVGLNVSVTALPSNSYFDLFSKKSTPFFWVGWSADYPDPQDFAENILTKDSAFDTANYDNPAYERLTRQGDTTLDPTLRARIYVQAQRIALQDVAFIPLGQSVFYMLWRPNIHGLTNSGVYADNTKVSVS